MNDLVKSAIDFNIANPSLLWGMENVAAGETPRTPQNRLAMDILQKRLEDKAAAKRIAMSRPTEGQPFDATKASLWDYIRTMARVPEHLVRSTVEGAISGLTLPGDVAAGKVDPLSEEGIRRSLDLTGTIGSATLAAPKGAIGAGAVRPNASPVKPGGVAGFIKEITPEWDGKIYRSGDVHTDQPTFYHSDPEGAAYYGKNPTAHDMPELEKPVVISVDPDPDLRKQAEAAGYKYYDYDELVKEKLGFDPGKDFEHENFTGDVALDIENAIPGLKKDGYDGAIIYGDTGAETTGMGPEIALFPKQNEPLLPVRVNKPSAPGLGKFGTTNLGDKAVYINGKLYTNDRAHVNALEQAAIDAGYESLEDALTKNPNIWQDLDGSNFGEINDRGEFVSFDNNPNSDSELGSVTYEDLLNDLGNEEDTLFSGGKASAAPGLLAMSAERAPAFYSAVEKVLDKTPMVKASGDQWLATLKNAPGVKQEELEALGMTDALKGKASVTKEELQLMLDEKSVKLGETWKGGPAAAHEDDINDLILEDMQRYFDEQHPDLDPNSPEYQEMFSEWEDSPAASVLQEDLTEKYNRNHQGDTKYSSYQLPGGENYRELLVTLPYKTPTTAVLADAQKLFKERNPAGDWFSLSPEVMGYYIDEVEAARSKLFISSHWDEPNVLAHARLNDRVLPGDGKSISEIEDLVSKTTGIDPKNMGSGIPGAMVKKGIITPEEAADWSRARGWLSGFETKPGNSRKTLFIEELQSDWHQKGKKEGYKSDLDSAINEAVKAERAWIVAQQTGKTPEEIAAAKAKYDEAMARRNEIYDTVPDAPFKKSWPDLLLKRLVRQAVEEGKDQIAWTDGLTQAERYDLSKHIERVEYDTKTNKLEAFKDGIRVMEHDNIPPDKLADYIGKEAADKLINKPSETIVMDDGSPVHVLSGLDLKVGGEGMRAFYDQELPRRADKLFKKYGVKTGDSKLGGSPEASFDAAYDYLLENGDETTADWLQDERFYTTPRDKQDIIEAAEEFGFEAPKATVVHVLPITPELRKAALEEGFPLFSSGVPLPHEEDPVDMSIRLTPVDHDPFGGRGR